MKANDILKQVLATLESRGKENGYDQKEERSADSIAEIFNTISGKDFVAADVWTHMIALKLARLKSQIANGSDVSDSIVDLIGYAALLGEELTKDSGGVNTKEELSESNQIGRWISWHGGDNPLMDDALVEGILRDGTVVDGPAAHFTWRHYGHGKDIVEYCVIGGHKSKSHHDGSVAHRNEKDHHRGVHRLDAVATADEDGWILWGGGECLEEYGTLVDVEYRDGDSEIGKAWDFRWSHLNNSSDIVKYRILK